MGTSTVEQLLENVCLLLASRTRDVVKSALGFIKVAVVVMDVVCLAKHVQLVVSVPFPSAVATWPEGCRQRPSGALRTGGFRHFFSHMLSCAAEGHAGALEGLVVEAQRQGRLLSSPHGPSIAAWGGSAGQGQWVGPPLVLDGQPRPDFPCPQRR